MTETAPAGHPGSREWRALAGARRLGAACETAAWSYGDRHIGPKPFIRQRCLLGPADYAHARRGENVDGRR